MTDGILTALKQDIAKHGGNLTAITFTDMDRACRSRATSQALGPVADEGSIERHAPLDAAA